MPKVLVLKAPRRHVQNKMFAFLAEIWPKKITSRDGCVLPIVFTPLLSFAGSHTHVVQKEGLHPPQSLESQGDETASGCMNMSPSAKNREAKLNSEE